VLLYAPPDDEYDEDNTFQVIGETDFAGLSVSDDYKGVPVRILTNFAVYKSRTRQLVPIGELVSVNLAVNSKNYRASGCVKPYINDNKHYTLVVILTTRMMRTLCLVQRSASNKFVRPKSESSPFMIYKTVLQIARRVSVCYIRDTHFQIATSINVSKLYILTKHAWYIFDRPSEQYIPFFDAGDDPEDEWAE